MRTTRTRPLLGRTAACWVLGCLAVGGPASAQDANVIRTGSPVSVGIDETLLERGVQLFRDAVERDELRGAVLMVARRGRIVLHEAIGWRHRAYRLPMAPDTLFRMASNTKPVVATAVLILVEEGKLALDDPVAKHLPSFDNWRSRTITVKQLLNHTSGFRIEPIFYPFDEGSDPTLRAAVAKFGMEGPAIEPGTSYSYSNPGYNTLGAVIEVASGTPLEEFLESRIYEPLGMHDTLNHEDADKRHRMAAVYRGRVRDDGAVEFRQRYTPGDPPDFPVVRASGGMISTAMDYARFLQMYLNLGRYGDAQILSANSVEMATSPTVTVDPDSAYGLGWRIVDGTFSHAGSDGTFAWADPSRELFGIVFTQSPGGKNPRAEFQRLVTEAVDAGAAQEQ